MSDYHLCDCVYVCVLCQCVWAVCACLCGWMGMWCFLRAIQHVAFFVDEFTVL